MALDRAKPGDCITLEDGRYAAPNGAFVLRNSGTRGRPIIIRARNRLQARLHGNRGVELDGHVVIEGFTFRCSSPGLVVRSGHDVRITRNRFDLKPGSNDSWIVIYRGHHNRFDHNLIENRQDLGHSLFSITPNPEGFVQFLHVDRNHFRNIGPPGKTAYDGDLIIIGSSLDGLISGWTTIEHNLFENITSDAEILSIKSSDNTSRNNTFLNCFGVVDVRVGYRATVEGNFFLNPQGQTMAGGIRLHGKGHRVVKNYFHGLTGAKWVACVSVADGDTDPRYGLLACQRYSCADTVIASNTFVGHHGADVFTIGGSAWDKSMYVPPENITIANNVILHSGDRPVVNLEGDSDGCSWSGNIVYSPQGRLKFGMPLPDGVRRQDPRLAADANGLYRLTAGSPAINASPACGALGVTHDMDGQFRDRHPDIGADEWSDDPIVRRPLTARDVGPNAPEGIAVSLDDATIVRPPSPHACIQKFDRNGKFVARWGSFGDHQEQLKVPRGIAAAPGGDLLVADYMLNQLKRFSGNGKTLSTWVRYGVGNGLLYYPTDVAVDTAGNLFVVESLNIENGVKKFSPDGSRGLAAWGPRGTGDGEFFGAHGIGLDESGNIYVADSGGHRIQKFRDDGKFLVAWGTEGSDPGEFRYPTDVAVDSQGNIYVSDTLNHRIQKFNSRFELLTTWGSHGNARGQFSGPTSLAIDQHNHVYVVDAGNARVQKFDQHGRWLTGWGTRGRGAGQFMMPAGIAIDKHDNVLVSDIYSVAWAGGTGAGDHAASRGPQIVHDSPSNEASVVRLPDGTLKLFWIAEDRCWSIASHNHGRTWNKPVEEFSVPPHTAETTRTLVDRRGELHVCFLVGRGVGNRRHGVDLFYDVWHARTEHNRRTWDKPRRIFAGYVGALRGMIQMENGRMLLTFGQWIGGRRSAPPTGSNEVRVLYSDDDGRTWKESAARLKTPVRTDGSGIGGVEPTLVQLTSGRLWMLIRNDTGTLYQATSMDGIEWTPPTPSRFASSESPARLLKLRDGRIVLIWNNCQELTPPKGRRFSAYSGRDVLHAAISEDDGRTWRGFREILRDPLRNQTPPRHGDRGTAYPDATETDEGFILVVSGQGDGRRKILRFRPRWLYATAQTEDFTNGLDRWCIFTAIGPLRYVWRDRAPGAALIAHPTRSGRRVLRLGKTTKRAPDGAVWNFPMGRMGRLTIRLMLRGPSSRALVALADRFFDPTDNAARRQGMFLLNLASSPADEAESSVVLTPQKWHELQLDWSLDDEQCAVAVDGQHKIQLPMRNGTANGICYLRLRFESAGNGNGDFLVESAAVQVREPWCRPLPLHKSGR